MREAAARQLLMGTGWLALMPAEFRDALIGICVWKRLAAGEPLYAAGDPPGGIYGIAQGAISYTAALGRADSPALHIGKAVIWTGLGPLLSGQPRRASIIATSAVLAAYAPLAPLHALLAARPEWWLHIAQELLIEFDVVLGSANDLMIRSARRRCAATLLRLANFRFQPPAPGEICAVQITQAGLAEMANLSRGSVSAIIQTMVNDRHVAVSYRAIEIRDYRALRAIADGD